MEDEEGREVSAVGWLLAASAFDICPALPTCEDHWDLEGYARSRGWGIFKQKHRNPSGGAARVPWKSLTRQC